MRPLSLQQIGNYLGVVSNNQEMITKVIIDSRLAQSGSLFFALHGENVDGHQFVNDVLARGGFAIVKKGFGTNERIIEVTEPSSALGDLARSYLASFTVPVIGVTGSNGKTTTKDMIAAVLASQWQVHKTPGNFNNELGLPLTVLSLEPEDQALVVEMGMRGLGQIRQLTEIAPLDVAVITNIGPVHLELLGSQDAIAKAKGEILQGLKPNGVAILNGDDPLVRKQAARIEHPVIYYGLQPDNDLQALHPQIDTDGHIQYTCVWQGQTEQVVVHTPGRHNVFNSLAAIGVGLHYNLSLAQCADSLKYVGSGRMRMEVVPGFDGVRIINDAYNASPASMRSALDTLVAMASKRRRIAVLGDMLELGAISAQAHRQVGAYAASCCDVLIFVGSNANYFRQGAIDSGFSPQDIDVYASVDQLIMNIAEHVKPQDIILIKASRGVALERVMDVLERGREGQC